MRTIQKFEDLEVWRKAREFTKNIYDCSKRDAFARDCGLQNQIRRASVSIMSNIAEGFERDGNKEFVQFLALTKASCGEARAQLCVAFDQHYIDDHQFGTLTKAAIEIGRMLAGLMQYLRRSEIRGLKYKSMTA